MKGYYLFAPVEPKCVGPDSGIERKVRSQCRALQSFSECELVILPVVEYSGSVSEKIIRRLPFTAAWRKWEYDGCFDDADYLYIRQPNLDDSFVRYLKKIKRCNRRIIILLEIPTYPPQPKKWTASSFVFDLKHTLCGPKAAKYVDAIINFYGYQEIWGRPGIATLNGFEFDKVLLPHRKLNEEIHFISVAETAYWHGYDRVIEGLHLYYEAGGRENYVYHMVGTIMPEHQKKVEEYGLEKHVILHGRMFGEALAEIYRGCLLGVDVLGGHRKNYPVSSSLKSREYGAWGIPVITSSPIDYLEKDSDYQFIAPYDDSPLDFEMVSAFYHRLYDGKDCNELAQEIRSNAQEKCEMARTMEPIIRWVEKNKK